MCYAAGSLDQAVNVCPMCKVFPHARCPHQRELCRNRTAHPRSDILYLKNAEVDTFNGCGYCKWARTSPPPKAAGWNNTGWPGCCRAPTPSEHRLIQHADWRSVSVVHHVQIPPDIKAALDDLSSRGSPVPSASPVRTAPTVKPPVDRRNSSASVSAKSAAMPIPTKSRSGGSPQMTASSITSNSSRGSGGSGGGASTSVPKTSTMEEMQKRRDSEKPPGSSNSSPSRKHIDLGDPITPRRNSGGRPPPSTASPSVTKVITDALSSGTQERRRSLSSAAQSTSSTSNKASPPISAKMSPPARPVEPPKPLKKAEAETSSASSSSGSDSLGSMTESTVTSDGGFTDYLSDESEAELQRQAEAKAALVAQNEAEELEFRQARQALANIGLRPPKSWTGTETERARIAASTRI
ncbi:hypothetical protein B0H11DRAFT_2271278 [Mycena galericulata]|nr:hypothetical protein B0H11DRAFT_2271278 [Mycena galericulata]